MIQLCNRVGPVNMDNKILSYKHSELVSLRKIENEFWNTLENNLMIGDYPCLDLKPLMKAQKSINNILMKLIGQTSEQMVKILKTEPSPIDE